MFNQKLQPLVLQKWESPVFREQTNKARPSLTVETQQGAVGNWGWGGDEADSVVAVRARLSEGVILALNLNS